MERETLFQRINRRAWFEIRNKLHGEFYLLSFRAYWHYLLRKARKNQINQTCFFAARPHIYAGIGHQMANWIAGLWCSKQFGLRFANIPFSTDKWDDFLGFSHGEIQYYDLIEQGYKVRRLPKFDENNQEEIDIIKNIISSYSGLKVILLAIQDQFYFDQFGVCDDLKRKFYNAPSRQRDQLRYNASKFNIAIHIRRTVIINNKIIEESDDIKAQRWLDNNYYENVLKKILENIKVNKPISIWLFSTGKSETFAEFEKYGEMNFCTDLDEYNSFAHLVFADLLITSKSSFSYKPALLNNGIKVCPRNFWHGYPDKGKWVLCENNGNFDVSLLSKLL
jgi:hypothetical protein